MPLDWGDASPMGNMTLADRIRLMQALAGMQRGEAQTETARENVAERQAKAGVERQKLDRESMQDYFKRVDEARKAYQDQWKAAQEFYDRNAEDMVKIMGAHKGPMQRGERENLQGQAANAQLIMYFGRKVADYYGTSDAKPEEIQKYIGTLMANAKNDPMLKKEIAALANRGVTLEQVIEAVATNFAEGGKRADVLKSVAGKYQQATGLLAGDTALQAGASPADATMEAYKQARQSGLQILQQRFNQDAERKYVSNFLKSYGGVPGGYGTDSKKSGDPLAEAKSGQVAGYITDSSGKTHLVPVAGADPRTVKSIAQYEGVKKPKYDPRDPYARQQAAEDFRKWMEGQGLPPAGKSRVGEGEQKPKVAATGKPSTVKAPPKGATYEWQGPGQGFKIKLPEKEPFSKGYDPREAGRYQMPDEIPIDTPGRPKEQSSPDFNFEPKGKV